MKFDFSQFTFEKLAGRLTNVVLLGFFTLVLSLPLVTAGPAFTACHAAMKDVIVNDNDKPLRYYFERFKEDFRLSALVFLCHIVFLAVLIWDLVYYRTGEGVLDILGQAAVFSLLCLLVFEMTMAHVVIAERMESTLKGVFTKALDIAFSCIGQSLMILLLTAAAVIVTVVILRPFLLVLPGLIVYLQWLILPEMLRRYKFKKGNAVYQRERRNEK